MCKQSQNQIEMAFITDTSTTKEFLFESAETGFDVSFDYKERDEKLIYTNPQDGHECESFIDITSAVYVGDGSDAVAFFLANDPNEAADELTKRGFPELAKAVQENFNL